MCTKVHGEAASCNPTVKLLAELVIPKAFLLYYNLKASSWFSPFCHKGGVLNNSGEVETLSHWSHLPGLGHISLQTLHSVFCFETDEQYLLLPISAAVLFILIQEYIRSFVPGVIPRETHIALQFAITCRSQVRPVAA